MPEKLIQILLGVRIVLDASNVFRAASRLFSTANLSHTHLLTRPHFALSPQPSCTFFCAVAFFITQTNLSDHE